MMKRGRFAPTPSGELHIGNSFTALCAWLQIRQTGGQLVLRVEDIDKARSREAWMLQQLDDLRWLGLDWEEGPDRLGPFAPYEQRHREALYEDALQRLAAAGFVYPCYCSRAELAAIGSAPHGLSTEGPVYPGTCRHLGQEERHIRGAQKTPSLRFAMADGILRFDDAVCGQQAFDAAQLGDFIVKRADSMFSYQLAVTIDDAAMQITNVLRGHDLLDSTPRQLSLYAALGFQPPQFAHVPLIGDAEGNRLSKRDKSLTLASLRAGGVPPERLIGMLAWLAGWQAQLEPVSAAALIPCFNTQRLNTPLIRVTHEQLDFLFT